PGNLTCDNLASGNFRHTSFVLIVEDTKPARHAFLSGLGGWFMKSPKMLITKRKLQITLASLTAAVLVAGLAPFAQPARAENPAINKVWQRTDYPVQVGKVARTWVWGNRIAATTEPMAESPGGSREVVYFDKARMEINDPNANPSSPWYVTNGL